MRTVSKLQPAICGWALLAGLIAPCFSIAGEPECVPAPAGLVGWWTGDGHALDLQNGLNGTLKDGASFAPGQHGNAFSLDGVDDYVLIPASPKLDVGMSAGLTIETWFNSFDVSVPSPIVEWNRGYGSNPYGVHLWLSTETPVGAGSGSLYANLVDTSGSFHILSSAPGLVSAGEFYHVAVSYNKDSGVAAMYLNGTLVALAYLGTFTPQTSDGLAFGRRIYGEQVSERRFKGMIDEVAIYDRALSASEVAALYAAPKCRPPAAYVDGIPITWREEFFGSDFTENPLALATADPDEDGANNFQEFLGGTDPLNAGSNPSVPTFVSTYAGSEIGDQDGPISEATFWGPSLLTLDSSGRLFVSEADIPDFWSTGENAHRVRVIDQGIVSTWTGSKEPGLIEGPRSEARFRGPMTVVFDSWGNAFVADRLNHRIRKITPEGIVSTFAGSSAGYQDGIGTDAQFYTPIGMCIDADDNLYVADFDNIRVRKISPQGEVTTFAGSVRGAQDGYRTSATFNSPHDVAITSDGVFYVADWVNGTVRRIAQDGMVSTFASDLPYIEFVTVDAGANVYASVPSVQHGFYKFAADGTLIWSLRNAPGFQDGPATEARFARYQKAAFLPDGNIVIGDGLNARIRLITLSPLPLLVIDPAESMFTNSVSVNLINTAPNAMLQYTLDGSEPTPASPNYSSPFFLTTAATVKARLFINGNPVSDIVTASYARVYALDDGIPASWREQHFGPGYLTDPRVAADADPDGDGSHNWQEFIAGTDPLDPLSGFTVGLRMSPVLTWNSVPGQEYRVLRKESLDAPEWAVVAASVAATESVTTFIDLEATGSKGFYVIEPLP